MTALASVLVRGTLFSRLRRSVQRAWRRLCRWFRKRKTPPRRCGFPWGDPVLPKPIEYQQYHACNPQTQQFECGHTASFSFLTSVFLSLALPRTAGRARTLDMPLCKGPSGVSSPDHCTSAPAEVEGYSPRLSTEVQYANILIERHGCMFL